MALTIASRPSLTRASPSRCRRWCPRARFWPASSTALSPRSRCAGSMSQMARTATPGICKRFLSRTEPRLPTPIRPTPIVSAGAAEAGEARTWPATRVPVAPRKSLRFSRSSIRSSRAPPLEVGRRGNTPSRTSGHPTGPTRLTKNAPRSLARKPRADQRPDPPGGDGYPRSRSRAQLNTCSIYPIEARMRGCRIAFEMA